MKQLSKLEDTIKPPRLLAGDWVTIEGTPTTGIIVRFEMSSLYNDYHHKALVFVTRTWLKSGQEFSLGELVPMPTRYLVKSEE